MAGLSARQNEVIFAHTRYEYSTYVDYRGLAHLAGYKSCHVDEIEFDRYVTYIISPVNEEFSALMKSLGRAKDTPRKCRIIYWQLERPDAGNWHFSDIHGTMVWNQVEDMLAWVDKVWVPHGYTAKLDSRAIYVPVGSDPLLRVGESSEEKKYDIALMAYDSHRRQPVFNELKRRFRVAPNASGEERARLLNESRCMVAVHQTPMPICEPQRFAIAAAYKLPFFTETVENSGPLVPGKHFHMAPIDEIVDMVEFWLSTKSISGTAENLYHELAINWNFKHCVEGGIMRSFK